MPGWEGRAHVVRALDGGITNRNLLIAVGDERFVLRIAGNDTELLEIRRPVEHRAARRAADLGIAPEVTGFVEPEGWLVTRFVDGAVLTPDEIADPARLTQIAGLLRSFHSSPLLGRAFDAFRVPWLHRDAAQRLGIAIPPAFDVAADAARNIAAAFAAAPEQPVPCHNDLLNANFLASAERLWLIDWEYAGDNDRYFDLGNLSVNNELDADARGELVRAYFGAVTRRRSARLELMTIMSDFREAMWGVVQRGISQLDFDYAAYSERHFDRLVRATRSAQFDDLLRDAASGIPDA